ncbi:MAG: hypothetical protein ACMXYL_03255 [Candidatus Woesearchaeota archaeon]
MQKKAQGLPLNTIIIAIIVIVVLVVLILLFTGQMTIFGDTLGVFQCRGLDCDIIPGGLSDGIVHRTGVTVSVPDRVAVGNPVEVVVDDREGIIASTGIYATSPSSGTVPGGTGGAIAVQRSQKTITGRVIDDGGGAGRRTFTIIFEDTHTVGVYPYQVIGTLHNGTRIILAEGEFRVYDPDSEEHVVRVVSYHPNNVPYTEPIIVMMSIAKGSPVKTIQTTLVKDEQLYSHLDYEFHLLLNKVRTDNDYDVYMATIDYAKEYHEGLWSLSRELTIFLDEDDNELDVIMPSQIPKLIIQSSLYCDDSKDCPEQYPYCVSTQEGLKCSSSCSKAAEYASDQDSCCEGLSFHRDTSICYNAHAPFTIAIMPFNLDESQSIEYQIIAENIIAAIREKTPIRDCIMEHAAFRYVIIEEYDCIQNCNNTVYLSEYESPTAYVQDCRRELYECALQHVPEPKSVDRVIGIMPAKLDIYWITEDKPFYSFIGTAEIPGRTALLTLPSGIPEQYYDIEGSALHEIGHTFGLKHLSCQPKVDGEIKIPDGACTGPNHNDCQPSCIEPAIIPMDCGSFISFETCLEDEHYDFYNLHLCFSELEHNKDYIMNYCHPYNEYGPAGYAYIRDQSAMTPGLVICGAV